MKAYKAFNSDWTCRGNQYEVGKTYHHEGELIICRKGLHACLILADCFNYYEFSPNTKIAEVIANDDALTHDDYSKVCAHTIEVVREIPFDEVLRLCNTGYCNTGYCNTGYFCTESPLTTSFDLPTTLNHDEYQSLRGIRVLNSLSTYPLFWIGFSDMSDDEKAAYPTANTTGGYLKHVNMREATIAAILALSDSDKDSIRALPNFDADKFERITGARI
jgi:hypothetical protein